MASTHMVEVRVRRRGAALTGSPRHTGPLHGWLCPQWRPMAVTDCCISTCPQLHSFLDLDARRRMLLIDHVVLDLDARRRSRSASADAVDWSRCLGPRRSASITQCSCGCRWSRSVPAIAVNCLQLSSSRARLITQCPLRLPSTAFNSVPPWLVLFALVCCSRVLTAEPRRARTWRSREHEHTIRRDIVLHLLRLRLLLLLLVLHVRSRQTRYRLCRL